LRGIDAKVLRDNVYLYDVKESEEGQLVTSGALGAVLLFINRSGSPTQALARPLEWAKALRLKDKQFRTDLAKKFSEDLDSLALAGVEVNAETTA
jgi:phosphoribosylamine-glycine ligase